MKNRKKKKKSNPKAGQLKGLTQLTKAQITKITNKSRDITSNYRNKKNFWIIL